MTSKLLSPATAFVLLFSPSLLLLGQQPITGLGLVFSENFDGFEGTEASVPTNFTVTSLTSFAFGGYYDSSGSWESLGGVKAMHDGVTPSDIAMGAAVGAGAGDGSIYFNWSFVNNTGGAITGFLVQWDFEQFSRGRATRITAEYNPAGDGWSTAGITGVNEQTAANPMGFGDTASNYSPRLATSNSFEIALGIPLQDGEGVVFRWGVHDGLTFWGGNAYVGINNVSVQAIPEPAAYSLIFLAAALGCAGVARRRLKFVR